MDAAQHAIIGLTAAGLTLCWGGRWGPPKPLERTTTSLADGARPCTHKLSSSDTLAPQFANKPDAGGSLSCSSVAGGGGLVGGCVSAQTTCKCMCLICL